MCHCAQQSRPDLDLSSVGRFEMELVQGPLRPMDSSSVKPASQCICAAAAAQQQHPTHASRQGGFYDHTGAGSAAIAQRMHLLALCGWAADALGGSSRSASASLPAREGVLSCGLCGAREGLWLHIPASMAPQAEVARAGEAPAPWGGSHLARAGADECGSECTSDEDVGIMSKYSSSHLACQKLYETSMLSMTCSVSQIILFLISGRQIRFSPWFASSS